MAEGFLKNAWYVAGWASELDTGMVARKVAGVPVVIARGLDGEAFALHDRCPHRFAPLSRGTVTKDGIQCGYHGLTFNAAGQCSANVLGGPTPSACRVAPYPLVIQDRVLWVWLGDPAKADQASIPRFPCFDNPAYRFVYGTIRAKANYQMLMDNLLDLTHAAFLHPSFGGLAYRPKISMTQEGETVFSHYIVSDIDNPEFPEVFWSAHGKRVDLWDDIRWNSPANLYLESGVVLTGRPREEGYIIPAVHALTPATRDETTYFWASALPADTPLKDEDFKNMMSTAFEVEDLPMIEAAWERMEGHDLWDLSPVMLRADAAAVIARRILSAKVKEEETAPGSAAS